MILILLELQLAIYKLNHPDSCCFTLDLLLRCCSSRLGRWLHWYGDFLSNHENLSAVFTYEKVEFGGICLYTQHCSQRQEHLWGLTGQPFPLSQKAPGSGGDSVSKTRCHMIGGDIWSTFICRCTITCTNIHTHTDIHTYEWLFTYQLAENRR